MGVIYKKDRQTDGHQSDPIRVPFFAVEVRDPKNGVEKYPQLLYRQNKLRNGYIPLCSYSTSRYPLEY